MNASNLGQLRPQRSRNPSGENESPSSPPSQGQGCYQSFNHPQRERQGSGSYGGAYESEDDLAFKEEQRPLMANSSSATPEEEKMKRKLKFFFMNPADKYIATRKIPWKLLLQILKVFIVTTQLWIFAEYRYAHVNYYTDQTISFEHFFIK